MVTQIDRTVTAVPERRQGKNRVGKRLGLYGIPVGAILALIGLWEAVVVVFSIPSYIVPSPVEVWNTLISDWGTLMANLVPTALETVLGFVIGNGIAILLAVVFVHSKPVER